jgi:hypothetical protein
MKVDVTKKIYNDEDAARARLRSFRRAALARWFGLSSLQITKRAALTARRTVQRLPRAVLGDRRTVFERITAQRKKESRASRIGSDDAYR